MLLKDEPFIKPNVINETIDNYLQPECSTICFKGTIKKRYYLNLEVK